MAIALSQAADINVTGFGTASSLDTYPFTGSPTIGNTVVIWAFVSQSSSGATLALSDTYGNTYTNHQFSFSIPSIQYAYGFIGHTKLTALPGTPSDYFATLTITGTAGNIAIISAEFSGAGDYDANASASGTSASPDPGSLTLADSGTELVVAMYGSDYSSFGASLTQPSGWNYVPAPDGDGWRNVQGLPGLISDYIYKLGVTSPSHPVWTNGLDGGASSTWGAVQVAFKVAGAGLDINPLFMSLL